MTRLDEKVAAELDAARKAVDGLKRVRADLKNVDDDLATLRSMRARARSLGGSLTS
jgi:hypothetical protein